MSGIRAFVDTNVLVYAHDALEGEKHRVAKRLVDDLWENRAGVVSTQVLQELYSTLCRKVAHPMPVSETRKTIQDFLRWRVIVNDASTIEGAFRLEDRYGISFWDAMIVQAALTARVAILYTEDLNHGQMIEGLEVRNPFVAPNAPNHSRHE